MIVTWREKFEIYVLATPAEKIPTLGQASHLPFSCKLVLERSQLNRKQYTVDVLLSLAGSLSPSSQQLFQSLFTPPHSARGWGSPPPFSG